MTDLQSELQASLGGTYTIERELTGGGMSRVFLAEEVALGRRVVIKVLPPELAAGVSDERFTREVHLAARLQHPHIVPVHSAGAAGNLPFFTMPFVEGDTLRARLQRGPIPLEEGIRILRDVARALEYAHQQGVVHRDIKPENIFLAGSSAVVSDFGIAKAISTARTIADRRDATAQETNLTAAGTAIGTPAYMAPEQAAGAPDIDDRADIYAFGCVAYEVLSGAPPFGRRPAHELIMAHIAEAPAPLAERAPAVSPALAALVMRCLAKPPADRPQSAGELLAALESLPTPLATPAAPISRRPGIRVMLAVGALVAVAAYAAYRIRATPTPATGAVTNSIAVIPFVNVGGDTATEYLSDGIADELATALGHVPNLRVASRSGAYRYKGRRDLDVREVGRTLNVGLVLTGTARRAAQQIRISAQLVSAADGVEIWSQKFDRTFEDVLALTDSLTAQITAALAPRLGAKPGSQRAGGGPATIGTSNPRAFDAYMRGKYSLLQRRAGLEGAAGDFSEAIAYDPNFARAYAGLGSTLALLTYFADSEPPDRPARSREAALTALRLDSTNAEAYVALGILDLTQDRWSEAQASLEQALALEPDLADAHFHLGRLFLYEGHLDEGVAAIEKARSLDPFSPVYTIWLGQSLAWVGQREQALSETRRAWELDSNSTLVLNVGSLAFAQQGQREQALRIARLPVQAQFQRGPSAWVLAVMGTRGEAGRLMAPVLARDGRRWLDQVSLAMFNLGVGDTARALDAMERAVDRDEPLASLIPLAAPSFDPVRASPRFAELVRRIGLDAAILASPRGGRKP